MHGSGDSSSSSSSSSTNSTCCLSSFCLDTLHLTDMRQPSSPSLSIPFPFPSHPTIGHSQPPPLLYYYYYYHSIHCITSPPHHPPPRPLASCPLHISYYCHHHLIIFAFNLGLHLLLPPVPENEPRIQSAVLIISRLRRYQTSPTSTPTALASVLVIRLVIDAHPPAATQPTLPAARTPPPFTATDILIDISKSSVIDSYFTPLILPKTLRPMHTIRSS